MKKLLSLTIVIWSLCNELVGQNANALKYYANCLAYKSHISLRDGDRNTAFRLVEFAHRYVDSENQLVIQGMLNALYYNENPVSIPIPRVKNIVCDGTPINCVAFSPDGNFLATCTGDYVHEKFSAKIYDIQMGKPVHIFNGHTSYLTYIAFSPDGKKLATASSDHTAKLWDVESGKTILTLNEHQSTVNSITFSSDGKYLATGSNDNTARIWDIQTGKSIIILKGHIDAVNSVTFSPDCKYLASASNDHTVKIWDIQSGNIFFELSDTASINCVAFSSEGKYIATGSDSNAQIWDVLSRSSIKKLVDIQLKTALLHRSPIFQLTPYPIVASSDFYRYRSGDLDKFV